MVVVLISRSHERGNFCRAGQDPSLQMFGWPRAMLGAPCGCEFPASISIVRRNAVDG
jgi:hypothetical protein